MLPSHGAASTATGEETRSRTRAGAARRSCGWFSPPHSSRMPRAVVLLFFFCRRSSSLSRAFSLVVVSCGTGPRQRASRPVVGVVRCVGIAAWGSSWPQEEEPRGRAAGAQKSRRSSPEAHPGNHRFLPCFFSRRIPWPHQRLKWPMALVVSVQPAPATEMAALMSVQSAPETEMAVQSAPETKRAA